MACNNRRDLGIFLHHIAGCVGHTSIKSAYSKSIQLADTNPFNCEALIQKAVAGVMSGRTSFVIAHRLSPIIQCDLILVFQSGRIVEQGTHADLLARGGYYTSLASHQLKKVAPVHYDDDRSVFT